jgi:CBS domain-containing protein
VYDYSAGKSDWMAAGFPVEGKASNQPTAGSVARRDVPTCRLEESLRDVQARAGAWNACVVVNEKRIVLGLLRAAELGQPDNLPAEAAMRPGPSTFRPHVPIAEIAEFMAEHDVPSVLVTTSGGGLIGLLVREDVERESTSSTRTQKS